MERIGLVGDLLSTALQHLGENDHILLILGAIRCKLRAQDVLEAGGAHLDTKDPKANSRPGEVIVAPGAARLEDEIQPPGVGHQVPELCPTPGGWISSSSREIGRGHD